jgi:hypothetical protein
VLPFLLGRWREALRLWLGIAGAYLALAGLTVWAVGLPYGFELYRDYLSFLTSIPHNYPWSAYYLGLNHSWYSILHWLFGRQPWVPAAVASLKLVTALPLVWRGVGWLRQAPKAARAPEAFGLALALHLWLMTTLDQLWEVTLAIVAAAYLWGVGGLRLRQLAAAIGVPFALLGLAQLGGWRLALSLGWPMDALDLTARLPLMLLVSLGLYGLVLWTAGRPKGL